MQLNKFTQSLSVAFQDAQSKREYDDNGYLIVRDCPVTLEGVFEYAGSEIISVVDDDVIDEIDPLKIYKVYRPASELKSEQVQKGVSVLPIIDDHKFVGEKKKQLNPDGRDGLVEGAIIGMPRFKAPYLVADLIFYTSNITRKIESGKVELSLGYTSRMLKESGNFNGEQYDFVMRDIVPNHLSLVDKGRSGSEVAVQDHFINKEVKGMTLEEILAHYDELNEGDKIKMREALDAKQSEKVVEDEEGKTEDSEVKDEDEFGEAGERLHDIDKKIDAILELSKSDGGESALRDGLEKLLRDSETKKVEDEEKEAVKDEEVKALTDSVAKLEKALNEGKRIKEVVRLIRQVSHKTGAIADAEIEKFETAEGLAKHFVESRGIPKAFNSNIDNLKAYAVNNQRQVAITDSAPKTTAQLPESLSFLKV